MMLDERHAVGLAFDPQGDVARVAITPGSTAASRPVKAALLLDASGFLVGIDLRDENGRGVVVMVGPHEAVATTREHMVQVHEDAAGGITAVTVGGARGAIRAGEKNPYI